MRTRVQLLAAASLALVLAACGGGTGASGAPTTAPASAAPSAAASPADSQAPAAGGDAVTIKDFAFAPGTLEVAVGTTVTWTNKDGTNHTVTADDDSFGSDSLGTDATFSQTFGAAGTYAYHCKIHPTMTGTVTVR